MTTTGMRETGVSPRGNNGRFHGIPAKTGNMIAGRKNLEMGMRNGFSNGPGNIEVMAVSVPLITGMEPWPPFRPLMH